MAVLAAAMFGVGVARGEPGDGLPELARSFYLDGIALQEGGDLAAAEVQFRKVLLLEPSWTDATLRLGQSRLEQGDVDGAVAAWRRAQFDQDCAEASGRALLAAGREEEALPWFRRLARLSSSEPRVELLVAAALAPGDATAALEAVDRFLTRRSRSSDDLLPAVSAVCAHLDDPDEALALVERAIAAQPELVEPLAELRRGYRLRLAARELMGAAPVQLESRERAQLQEARRRFSDGEVQRALDILEQLTDQVSRNPEVYAALADVREASGDIAGAEYALLLARRLAPLDPSLRARYAGLLSEHYGGRFDAEAAEILGRSLEGLADPELIWRQAELVRGAGEPTRAAPILQLYLSLSPEGPHAARASDLLLALERERVVPPLLPPMNPPRGVPEQAWFDVHLAQVLWETESPEDREQALQLIDGALAAAPNLLKAVNLKARIEVTQGRRAAAIQSFRRSLDKAPDQPAVRHELALLLAADGSTEEADVMFLRAAEAGSGPARFELARRDARGWRWWTARKRLDSYFEVASSGRIHREAIALREQLDRRILEFWGAVALSGGVVVFVPAVLLGRRRAGSPIRTLLDKAPGTYREVARVVSALRHEVLKHNISALPGVADALEDGDPGPAIWAAERLFGPGGAVRRFRRYVRELEDLGRSHGVTLNLRHRDPVFGPLIAGFDRLAGLRRRLERGSGRAVAELRAVSEALNVRGYAALGRLLRGVCVVVLEPEVFQSAWRDVLSEPAFQRIQTPEWSVQCGEGGLAVRAFRGDLHDILVNLVRNALAASEASSGARLGVRLDVEEDEITGLERVEIRVRDEAPRRISTAMIRGRYIERGLGLAVDMISRAGGSIHVEDEPGWSKAVVVRLPLEEGEAG